MGDMSSLGAMWVDAAASLVPRLQASAPTTDTDGACPTEAMDWLHEAGLCSAPLPQPNGGPRPERRRRAAGAVVRAETHRPRKSGGGPPV